MRLRSRNAAGGLLTGLLLARPFIAPRPIGAQQIDFGDRVAESKKGHVVLLTDSVEIAAGSPQDVEIRFRVDPGYHINSHAPKDELLLPTALKLEAVEGVKISGEQYPAGTAFRLQVGDGEVLDVYQSEFRVRLRLVAQRGTSTLLGALHYQACDNAACYPPRTLPVKVLITAK